MTRLSAASAEPMWPREVQDDVEVGLRTFEVRDLDGYVLCYARLSNAGG
jgi:hypothetical protein